MYKKPNIETAVLPEGTLMQVVAPSPVGGEYDPTSQAPGRNSGTDDPF